MKVYFHLGTHLKCAGTVTFILLINYQNKFHPFKKKILFKKPAPPSCINE